METKRKDISPRERILSTAAELFFTKGFRQTGINEVISKSGVAKATFYSHFPSKDDLCLAYLQDRNISEYESIISFVNDQDTLKGRFLAVIKSVEPWLEANGIRGCAFLNMVAEVPDPESRLRQIGCNHYDMVRNLIRDLGRYLIESDEVRYGHLNAEALADDYMIILAGAIAMSEIYNSTFPVRRAIQMVSRLIE